jgi:hypothetical protein
MADIADYLVEQMLDEGHFYGAKRRAREGTLVCRRCGREVGWRETADGWRLFDVERREHNRRYAHECTPPTADDFEDLS